MRREIRPSDGTRSLISYKSISRIIGQFWLYVVNMKTGFGYRMPRDAYCNNGRDHLRNHIHMTNCIHLRYHMHKHGGILSERSLMKDPNGGSPHSWYSPGADHMLLTRAAEDALVNGTCKECPRLSKRSSRVEGLLVSKAEKAGSCNSTKNGIHGNRRVKRGESSRWFHDNNVLCCDDNHPQGGIRLRNFIVSGHSESRNKDMTIKANSNQVKEITSKHNSVALSCNCGRRSQVKKIAGEAEFTKSRRRGNDFDKRRKFQGTRIHCSTTASLHAESQNDMSVAHSNQNITGVRDKGYGSPSKSSRIRHRGKNRSEHQLKIGGSIVGGRAFSDISEQSSSYTISDFEALPLLFDASGSLGSINHNARVHNCELGISADEQHKLRRQLTYRHQNITQKYMPRTFGDLVGQNLVVQALSNVIAKKKIGFLYVFYGPHGTGKTTCARIFARALNCQSPGSHKPCGLCDPCMENETGKSRNVVEISPIRNLDFGVMKPFGSTFDSWHHSYYTVFILDDCDALSTDYWSAVLKAIDQAPRKVVFILVCTSIDVLPHVLISKCQKFYFPKLKDADIIHTLEGIAANEDLEIDKDALKLIALRSDGSLRDAEMTLEQLSLLGQRVSLCLVQELVGLISDEKLVDLLDLALTADTVNTVKNLRDIMESGVEPLALMSQLATVITDILAGSYDMMTERQGRKFFRQQTLVSKEDMEKLRQALKTLSEAEKQLRLSNDKLIWLTAALLQLASDQPSMLPSSSTDSGLIHRKNKLEDIWLEVLEKIPATSIKEFMHQEGKLIKISGDGAAPTVHLLFNSPSTKSKAEKYRSHILQAFASVLRSSVTVNMECESIKSETVPGEGPIPLPLPPPLETDDQRKIKGEGGSNPSLSLVGTKVSLAHIILQHTEQGCSKHSGWLKQKALSIAQKMEHQNLRKLESRSRRLDCWKPGMLVSSRNRKILRLKIRRRPQMLLKCASSCYGYGYGYGFGRCPTPTVMSPDSARQSHSHSQSQSKR
ncbi:protein STICHEL-like 3 isoform X5 [Andrographis paniculata]|uniref:protein STICHEL-like 3 isoform X5 n=1 Tax=Andrographis paniculata TaxID=175694 RepID=UPI0021E937AD|nr:protein STICHEL-like 3 isoform X5 [Andrographis paniculata]